MHLKICFSSFVLFSSLATADDWETQDRIEITAKIPDYQRSLSNVLPQQQLRDETSFSADSLATLFSQAPAVNLNGQGGLFQAINIRGFARWRIQTLVEGIPIYTERRAGTSVEFLPPSFVGQAYLSQGAASTQLGSGAIGGGVDIYLTQPDQAELQASYGHDQSYREVSLQGLNELNASADTFTWQLNHRHANNSSDADGNSIQDRFEHNSLALRQRSENGAVRESFLLYSSANNIAKANADRPEDRFTLYPENTHLLGKMLFDWHNAAVYVHDSKLLTRVTRPGRRQNTIQNDSLDVGVQLNDKLQMRNWLLYWRAGIDARTGVKAFERETDALGQQSFARANLDAEQWESFVALDVSLQRASGTWAGGSRLAYQYQHDQLSNDSQRDANLSAFVGYAHALDNEWQLSAYLSSAYRVPSLTERYFNGSTPRGTTLGDPDLQTETALNLETSLAYEADDIAASLSVFQQSIDNYIERLDINDELRQYRNLDSADIRGINYQIKYDFAWSKLQWRLDLGGQWLRGEDQAGNAVADISPDQHRLALSVSAADAQGFIALVHRQSSDEIVAGELPTKTATTLDAGYTYQLTPNAQLSFNLTNLTDKAYVTSRDDLAPFAKGRDVHIGLRYSL